MTPLKDYLLEREKEFDEEFVDGARLGGDLARLMGNKVKSFQAETVRGVLERVKEGVEELKEQVFPRMGYTGEKTVRHQALDDVLSLLDTNEK